MTETRKRGRMSDATEEELSLRLEGALDAVIEIGEKRQQILLAMKDALVRGDEQEALELARDLTDLPRKRTEGAASGPTNALLN